MSSHSYEYDLIVIGGGSGGMSCAKQAASLGAKVALFDFVKPSTQGSTWGLGGTCVNVGCVPKKLMHFASLMGHAVKHDAATMGWNVTGNVSHNWETLVETVSNHVRMLNFRYRVGLKDKKVEYINAQASFQDDHTIAYSIKTKTGVTNKTVTAAHIVIAVGGRPFVPSDVPGAIEHAITSDDIFTLDHEPGKTLCVGASYIALECAGFLTELGYDVTVAARSILLRGFDRQCAEKIGSVMNDLGTKFLMGWCPREIVKLPSGKFQVVFGNEADQEKVEVFDTVVYATGRFPDTRGLNLDAAGVRLHSSGKVEVDSMERTNVPHIYAIGDVAVDRPELTPAAVQAGEYLARRLFAGSVKPMDYVNVPTTVFTPVEYGCVGLNEESAVRIYGEEDIEVYLSEFTTLELSALHRMKHSMHGEEVDMGHVCLSKLICVKSQNEKVVGFHFVGPNAGEITQGFALAVKLGALKSDFDDLVGIHPTDAESFCALSITKRSGVSFSSAGGCGGGVCG